MPVALSDGFTIHTKHATTLFYTVQCVCLIAKGVGGHTVRSVVKENHTQNCMVHLGMGGQRRGEERS